MCVCVCVCVCVREERETTGEAISRTSHRQMTHKFVQMEIDVIELPKVLM